MSLKAVHFGAGNIGRGFVAEFVRYLTPPWPLRLTSLNDEAVINCTTFVFPSFPFQLASLSCHPMLQFRTSLTPIS
jgi:hypothetical protein